MVGQLVLAFCTLSATAAFVSPALARSPSPSQVYKGLTSYASIPYATKSGFNGNGLLLDVSVNGVGVARHATVDTGSTAFLIGSENYPSWSEVEANLRKQGVQPAYEYLSSSGNVYTGYKMDVNIGFPRAKPAVSSRVQALVVTQMVKCKGYGGSGPCPTAQIVKSKSACDGNCRQMYMGVGFGRASDGQTEFTPINNALLQVDYIDGKRKPKDFRTGYIITPQNITVGITEHNSVGFKLVKLNHANASEPLDWQQVTGSVSVTVPGNSQPGPWVPANFLLDTGITKSFLDLPLTSGVSKNESLPVNTTVSIRFGEINGTQIADDAEYSYTVGVAPNGPTDADDKPYAYNHILTNTTELAFVNTGVHFYRTNNILFDADGGYWGISTHSSTNVHMSTG